MIRPQSPPPSFSHFSRHEKDDDDDGDDDDDDDIDGWQLAGEVGKSQLKKGA